MRLALSLQVDFVRIGAKFSSFVHARRGCVGCLERAGWAVGGLSEGLGFRALGLYGDGLKVYNLQGHPFRWFRPPVGGTQMVVQSLGLGHEGGLRLRRVGSKG